MPYLAFSIALVCVALGTVCASTGMTAIYALIAIWNIAWIWVDLRIQRWVDGCDAARSRGSVI